MMIMIVLLFLLLSQVSHGQEQIGDSGNPIQEAWKRMIDDRQDKQGLMTWRESCCWFVGFVESQCNTVSPMFWRKAVINGKFNSKYKLGMAMFDGGSPYKLSQAGFFCPKDLSPVNTNVGLELRLKNQSFEIKSQKVLAAISKRKTLSAQIKGKHCVVVAYDNDPLHCDIYLFSTDLKEPLWSNVVRPTIEEPDSFAGFYNHRVQPVFQEDGRVLVFGICATIIYLEEFHIDTGESIIHFSSGAALTLKKLSDRHVKSKETGK